MNFSNFYIISFLFCSVAASSLESSKEIHNHLRTIRHLDQYYEGAEGVEEADENEYGQEEYYAGEEVAEYYADVADENEYGEAEYYADEEVEQAQENQYGEAAYYVDEEVAEEAEEVEENEYGEAEYYAEEEEEEEEAEEEEENEYGEAEYYAEEEEEEEEAEEAEENEYGEAEYYAEEEEEAEKYYAEQEEAAYGSSLYNISFNNRSYGELAVVCVSLAAMSILVGILRRSKTSEPDLKTDLMKNEVGGGETHYALA